MNEHQSSIEPNHEEIAMTPTNPSVCPKCREVEEFFDGIRVMARNRNPAGATILDFMACWNEQYEQRIAELTAEVERLRESNVVLERQIWSRLYSPSTPSEHQ